jgi:type 1 glutamine amidotransferase
MRYLAGLLVLLFLVAGCHSPQQDASPDSSAKAPEVKRVLVLTGADHPAHDWRRTAPVLADVLRQDTRLKVSVIENPDFLASPNLNDHDVVVLHFMKWEQPTPGPEARENLRRFVSSGGGMFVLHFACGAIYDWPEFANLAGRAWDPKLRAHDPKGVFRVNITATDHPITQGMKSFETNDELYTCLGGDRPVDLLATARSKPFRSITARAACSTVRSVTTSMRYSIPPPRNSSGGDAPGRPALTRFGPDRTCPNLTR